jgi:hypothetical protein
MIYHLLFVWKKINIFRAYVVDDDDDDRQGN